MSGEPDIRHPAESLRTEAAQYAALADEERKKAAAARVAEVRHRSAAARLDEAASDARRAAMLIESHEADDS